MARVVVSDPYRALAKASVSTALQRTKFQSYPGPCEVPLAYKDEKHIRGPNAVNLTHARTHTNTNSLGQCAYLRLGAPCGFTFSLGFNQVSLLSVCVSDHAECVDVKTTLLIRPHSAAAVLQIQRCG